VPYFRRIPAPDLITGNCLSCHRTRTRTAYVPALDESLQFGIGDAGGLNRKFRVRDNLPGTTICEWKSSISLGLIVRGRGTR